MLVLKRHHITNDSKSMSPKWSTYFSRTLGMAGPVAPAGPIFFSFFFEPHAANVFEAKANDRSNNMGGAQFTWQEDL